MSPAIPEEVFEELELLELPEGDSDVHSEPPEGRAAPVIDLALYPRSPEDPAEGQPAARAPARPSADNLRERAEGVILRHVVFAVGTGLTPFPLLDLAALLALNVRMVVQLAELHEVDVHEHRVRVAVSSLLTTASVPALMLPVSSLLRAVPVIGTTFGALAMPSLASSLTYATGRVFARHFAEGGRVESMDLGQARDALRRAMKERAGP